MSCFKYLLCEFSVSFSSLLSFFQRLLTPFASYLSLDMMSNPENLPKARLIEELRKRGVHYSPAKSKDYYVSLYKQHFARRSVRHSKRSEFSSDDDAIARSLDKVRNELNMDSTHFKGFKNQFIKPINTPICVSYSNIF